MEQLTPEQIKEKADIISARIGSPVHPICFTRNNGEQVVGYIAEPKRQAKFAAIDELMRSPSSAGEILLRSCILKEDSDPRLYSENSADDDIVISAALSCLTLIQAYTNEIKKN